MSAAVSEARQPAQRAPAAPAAPQRPQPPAAPAQAAPGMFMQETRDARETRDRLNDIFNQHPPSVRDVLRIDPTLMYRADYLANYPVLAAFLEQHPEIAHNPSYFIGERRLRRTEQQPSDGSRARAEQCCGVRRRRVDRHDHHDRHRLSRQNRRRAQALAARHEGAERSQHQTDRSVRVERRAARLPPVAAGKAAHGRAGASAGRSARDGRAAQPHLLVDAVGHRARRARSGADHGELDGGGTRSRPRS